ncbi:SLC13 family permease [Pelagibius litoralis]|uniref:SLC13 family permease n=1 Tax=Pelagibius litoralis TaxID=374515 RepID=A0A967CC81_9PROT|nr:SLC13 family permease [Pelagibius litoralis]NIA68819.1 SLC13 family permease [Pelagibius litoralis]
MISADLLAPFQMGFLFVLVVVVLALLTTEAVSIELTSLSTIALLILFFHFFPVIDENGSDLLDLRHLLSGFANPALIAVLGLLVLGEGLTRTGMLDLAANTVIQWTRSNPFVAVTLMLVVVMVFSAVLNNIPVVVLFIPIMQSLTKRFRQSPSRYMMLLSYASVLGGMTTLIGSSTNLLVSLELDELGEEAFGFFDFTIPGLVMAVCGLAYLLLIAPRLLPDRPASQGGIEEQSRHFVAQVSVTAGSRLVGLAPVGGIFPALPNITILMIQRGEQAVLPPFEDVVLEVNDLIMIAATRSALASLVKGEPELLHPELVAETSGGEATSEEPGEEGRRPPWLAGGQVQAEVMIRPDSEIVGHTLEEIGFRYKHHCIVLGIERRSRMLRERITRIPLKDGDVLLIQGRPEDVDHLRGERSVVLMEWSRQPLVTPQHQRTAAIIFLGVIAASASGLIPIALAAFCGATAMIATRILSLGDALRVLDRKIILTIAMALALGGAMQATGGAQFLADAMMGMLSGATPAQILSAFFLLLALLSNVLSTKATAVLFTPIAVDLAYALNLPVEPFAVAVIFASNCSFASPIGYQTNLVVMTPGNYRFMDFVRVGLPLIFLVWIAFSLFAPWYYDLPAQ